MINFDEACKQIGYDRTLAAPTVVYGYYAYKNGQCSEHDKRDQAELISKNVERFIRNQNEMTSFWEGQSVLEEKASKIFHDALRQEYSHLSDELYNIAYSEACERGHSAGYDEVANSMIGVVSLIQRVTLTMF